jgi:hypothetical protein
VRENGWNGGLGFAIKRMMLGISLFWRWCLLDFFLDYEERLDHTVFLL